MQENNILTKEDNRLVHNIIYHDIWEYQQKQYKSMWLAFELDFSKDLMQWKGLEKGKLTDAQKDFILRIIAFFASSDTVVAQNIENFIDAIKLYEVRSFYATQEHMENVHAETYANMLKVYCEDDTKKYETLVDSVNNDQSIAEKIKWAIKWSSDKSVSYSDKMVIFAIIEGVFFSGSFCAIYWFRSLKLLDELCKANDYIARDEALHVDFASYIYKNYVPRNEKMIESKVYNIIQEAVNIESNFICSAISDTLQGEMTKEKMTEYIKFVANRTLKKLGYNELFEAKNPFSFMLGISLDNESNFFEKRPTEYAQDKINCDDDDLFTTF